MIQSERLAEEYVEPRAHQVKRLVGRCSLQAVRMLAPSKPPLEVAELDCISDAIGFFIRENYSRAADAALLILPVSIERPTAD
jgi:hypothetical protein